MKPLRKSGRPRILDGPGERVSAWIPASDLDRLIALAAKRPDRSVSGVLRELAHKAAAAEKVSS